MPRKWNDIFTRWDKSGGKGGRKLCRFWLEYKLRVCRSSRADSNNQRRHKYFESGRRDQETNKTYHSCHGKGRRGRVVTSGRRADGALRLSHSCHKDWNVAAAGLVSQ